MRKLVTIRKVINLEPINGADKIELAHIGGWKCVVKKGEFNINDLALYFEIDSFLPVIPAFEFLGKPTTMHTGDIGYRIKTIRLKGELSQGLLLPLSTFPDIDFSDTKKDYSEDLGVILYEQPINTNLQGLAEGLFPSYIIPKTDQERIQNLPDYFSKYSDVEFEITEKLDGTSVTYYLYDGHFGVCSRNLELKRTENNLLWSIAIHNNIEDKLKHYGRNVAIQGELVGSGIQKNRLHLNDVRYFVFDIYDIDNKKYFTSTDRLFFCSKYELLHVPVVEIKSLKDFNMESIIDYANANSQFGNFPREGVVFKSINGDVSFKVISNNYLLKE